MNIDKKEFNAKFNRYIEIKDFRESNRFYNLNLHKDIKTIINNATFHFNFPDKESKEDVHSNILIDFLLKRPKLKKYKGNWYNILFTMFKNRFHDLGRTEKVRLEKIERLINLRDSKPELLELSDD